MQRMRPSVILTLFAGVLGGRLDAQGSAADVRVTEVVPVRNGVAARLCPGARNAVRVGIAWSGPIPERPIQVQISLAMRDDASAGVVVAEGSVTPHANASATTFTFLNVEVSERLRNRGARLVARVVADRSVTETDTTNNVSRLEIDTTDWTCKS